MKPVRRPRDPDLAGAEAALIRAGRNALELALQTGTSCWVMRDGKLVDLAAEVRGKSRTKAAGAKARRRSTVAHGSKVAKQESARFDPDAAEHAWRAFQRDLGVGAIHTEREYARTVQLMNSLIDVVGGNERHPLAGLLHLVGELVWSYESRALPRWGSAEGSA